MIVNGRFAGSVLLTAVLTACTTPAGGPLVGRGVVSPDDAKPATQSVPAEHLRLEIVLDREVYALGEPIYLTLRLHNSGSDTLRVIGSLDPTDGAVDVLVEGPGERQETFVPLVEADHDEGIFENLGPGAVLGTVVPIFFGADGWTFDEPGRFEVTAIYKTPGERGRTLRTVSTAIALEVRSSSIGARLVGEAQRSLEAGKFLTWQSGDHLEQGRALLEQALEAEDQSPLSDYIHSAFARSLGEPFADYRAGRVRPPDCQQALNRLVQVTNDRLHVYVRMQNAVIRAKCAFRTNDREAAGRYLKEARGMAEGKPEYRGLLLRIDELQGRLDSGGPDR